MKQTNEKRLYSFKGAVKLYDRIWADNFKAQTMAVSPGKAKANIICQVKEKMNRSTYAGISLIGDIIPG